MERSFLGFGALSACIAVAAGAFGAHALTGMVTADRLAIWETAARYQMYHALGLLIVAYLVSQKPAGPARLCGWLFVAGTVLFSGSLYALTLTGITILGAVTPLGGIAFIAGWLALAWGVWRPAPVVEPVASADPTTAHPDDAESAPSSLRLPGTSSG
jgi:uncharacterized membrane protein YgdD (TMEM256/DUF423 family)